MNDKMRPDKAELRKFAERRVTGMPISYANMPWISAPIVLELLDEIDELEKLRNSSVPAMESLVHSVLYDHQHDGASDAGFVFCHCGWEGPYSKHPSHISEKIVKALSA